MKNLRTVAILFTLVLALVAMPVWAAGDWTFTGKLVARSTVETPSGSFVVLTFGDKTGNFDATCDSTQEALLQCPRATVGGKVSATGRFSGGLIVETIHDVGFKLP